ncbi:MAG TPA: antibiotic biosynthesis monooxygenase [Bordetella sp.]
MINEIAVIFVKEGAGAAFEAAVNKAKPLFLAAKGCHGVQLFRSIEKPLEYTLVVDWETVEHHMVDFRESEAFKQWRALIGDSVAQPAQVHHVNQVM